MIAPHPALGVIAPPKRTVRIVGVSDMAISTCRDEVLRTYSIGSCLGLTLYDPVACVGGLIHSMLPFSRIDPVKARENPSMFTDTGVTALLQAVFDLGARRQRLLVKAAGGSRILDEKGLFNIGEKNYFVLRKILWKNNILITAEDVGGTDKRTVSLHMDTGATIIKKTRREREL